MRHRLLGRLLSVAVLCAGGLLAGPSPATWASCGPTPPASPVVFTGTVLWTQRDGRVAHVRTDTGQRVTVIGTPSSDGVTTVDRTYEVGARYEFHPLNATDPFQDNSCTRTHLIAPASSPTPCPAGKKRTVARAVSSPGSRTACPVGSVSVSRSPAPW